MQIEDATWITYSKLKKVYPNYKLKDNVVIERGVSDVIQHNPTHVN